MTEVTIGGKAYSIGFTMLSVVRSKALTGKGFFQVAAAEKLDAEAAMEKVLDLLLLGLQTKHGDQFKSVEDVAVAFPDMASITAVGPAVNSELQKFLSVDASQRKRADDAQNAEAKSKKKSRSTRSAKTPIAQSA